MRLFLHHWPSCACTGSHRDTTAKSWTLNYSTSVFLTVTALALTMCFLSLNTQRQTRASFNRVKTEEHATLWEKHLGVNARLD